MNTLKLFLALLALSQLPVLFDEPDLITAKSPEEAREQLASLLSEPMRLALARNECTDALLHRIEAGRWDDAWCASHYAHLVRAHQ